MARLVAVDLARAVAVFGMFAVHVGPFPRPPTASADALGLAVGHHDVDDVEVAPAAGVVDGTPVGVRLGFLDAVSFGQRVELPTP
ncbi:hypothetical protein ACFPH6_16485 [Streptomyces xiangluensis]|uniref:Secreted protein n=1 Tax=Streptomyces xiangluensis TaxID=2665720 RepID=A0ABV8YQ41_9ACTN